MTFFCLGRNIRSVENEQVEKILDKIGTFVDDSSTIESDEANDEEKKDTNTFIVDSKESNSNSNEENDDDDNNNKQDILSNFMDFDQQKTSHNSDEN